MNNSINQIYQIICCRHRIHMYSMINEIELSPGINTDINGELSSWEGFHENWMGTDQSFQQVLLGYEGVSMWKMKLDLYHLPCTKVNSKWMRDLKWKVTVLDTLSCPTFCHPMDGSPPGSFVLGIFQARVLEWVAVPFSRRSSQPRDWLQISCLAGRFSTGWATREPQEA